MIDGPPGRVVAIITGGGRGIGRSAAEFLAARGAAVAICSRSGHELKSTVDQIADATGHRPLAAVLDVTDPPAVSEFVSSVAHEFGPPTLVLNNAAMLGPVGPLDDIPIGDWMRTLEVNVGGVITVTQAAVREMTGGAVINLSGGGVGGSGSSPAVSAYVASKAAVVSVTELLSRELKPTGITVNALAPGAMTTRFTEPILSAGSHRAGDLYRLTVDQRENPAPIEPFCDWVWYLASPAGKWLTGRLISARWDRVEEVEARRAAVEAGNLYSLRRIDDVMFREVAE